MIAKLRFALLVATVRSFVLVGPLPSSRVTCPPQMVTAAAAPTGSTDACNLVDDQEHDGAPLSVQLTKRLALGLVLPRGIGGDTWKLEHAVFAPNQILNSATPV